MTAEDWSGRLTVRSGLDGTVRNAGVARYRDLAGTHLAPVSGQCLDDESVLLLVETTQSGIRVAEAARHAGPCSARDATPCGRSSASAAGSGTTSAWSCRRARA